MDKLSNLPLNQIVCADALVFLRSLPDDCVDLILTSPPYDNLRVYNGYSFDFEGVAHESCRVLKQGGVLVWVVGDATVDGSETLTGFRQAVYFKDVVNLLVWDSMIWKKITPGRFNKRYTPSWEFMFVLTKGEPKTFNPVTKRNKRAGSKTAASTRAVNGYKSEGSTEVKEFGVLENVWDIQGGASLSDRNGHPAAFPEELADRHIKTWTNEGDVVLDFFMGSGTTAKMARSNKRYFMGCDISAEYVQITHERLRLPFEEHHVPQDDDVSDLPLFKGML